jgi:hypothetical protein
MRLAIGVIAFDWIVVGWRTFVWLDLAAVAVIAWAASHTYEP